MAQIKVGAERSSRPGFPSSARIIQLVSERRQDSLRYNHTVFAKLRDWYNLYRGVWSGKVAQFRNNVSIPFTFAMIQSDVARKVQTSFGAWPIVSFEGYAPEDSARAKRNEVLVSAQMKDADSIVKAVDFFLQADIGGTGCARLGWKNLTRKTRVRRMESVAPGLDIPVVREYEAEMFNGPIWEPIDRLDVWQQPARKAGDIGWWIHGYFMDLDDMLDDVAVGKSYFDPRAVQLLKENPLPLAHNNAYIQRRLHYRNEDDFQARQNERFAKPVWIWEMEGWVPDEFAPDGIRHRCIAIGNERVVLKNREAPLPNGQLRLVTFTPMPDPFGFDGIGKAEICEKPQRTADRLANQKLDALDLLIDPMYVASSGANLNVQHLFTRAGRVLLVDGAANEDNIRALAPDMRGFQAAYPEISFQFQAMQLGTGETESLLGLQGSGNRTTARGDLMRQENAVTRLSMEARLADEAVEKIANGFRYMDSLWLSLPHQVKILGSIATVNPITGLPYPAEPVTVDYDDLAPDYRARAVGASQMLGRSVRQQNVIGLLQIMSSNPALMQMVNWANFARQVFDLFDFKNLNELLVNQIPMVNQLAAQNGTSPEQVAGAVSQPLDQLSPEILGQFMNQQNGAPMGNLVGAGY